MSKRIAAFVLLLPSVVSTALAQAPVEKEWKVEGVVRKALIYVPAAATKSLRPVIFVFHGHGGTMGHAARTMRYHMHWPKAIVVYPQGLNTPGKLTDPEGKKPGWQSGPGDQGDRDLKFFDAMLSSLKADHKVDPRHIYATGHSNGGAFTYLLWAKRGEVFAAVAPSAAVPNRLWFKDVPPLPALHVAGEADALVKYDWQKLAIAAVKKLNTCDSEGKEWGKAGKLVGTSYPSSKGTPLVVLLSPGGHQFPAEAPELIVRFFKEHTHK